MTQLYVVGGQQRSLRSLAAANQDWHGYQKGLIVRVDSETGQWEPCVDYVSPEDVRPAEASEILFQAGAVAGNRLYACTQTEVMVYSLPDFKRVAYISHPWFNDVHHVCPAPDGTLLVASAGLELVLKMTLDGEVCQVWNVLGEDPWARFSPATDYRKVPSTKPHRGHPNYVYTVGDELWVTRFHQSDTVSLTHPEKRIPLGEERIHDGVVHQGRVYFTGVSGRIIVANPATLQVEEVIDLNSMHPEGTLLGWCRSLLFEGDRLWVGFSRIRPTQTRENVAWLLRGFKRVRGSHIGCYDLARRRCVQEIDLEPADVNAVFSIYRAG